jgi:hypothetical protein
MEPKNDNFSYSWIFARSENKIEIKVSLPTGNIGNFRGVDAPGHSNYYKQFVGVPSPKNFNVFSHQSMVN